MDSVVVLLLGLVASVIAAELCSWLPALSWRILRFAVRRLPVELHDRYYEEWAADFAEVPGNLGKFFWSLGIIRASFAISRDRQRSVAAKSNDSVLDGVLDGASSIEQGLQTHIASLEASNRLKTEFIANLSHELRTPLNAVIGFAEVLDHEYLGPLNEKQADYVRGIVAATQRQCALVENLISIAAIDAGRVRLDLDTVDVGALLLSLEGLMVEYAGKHNRKLEIVCPPDIGTVVADEQKLKQVIYKLISNVIELTEEARGELIEDVGGWITMSARRESGEVAITVTNTAIPPEHQAQMFEEFGRPEEPNCKYGSGLELPLVKALVELHGGRVAIKSTFFCRDIQITCYIPGSLSSDATGESAARAGEE